MVFRIINQAKKYIKRKNQERRVNQTLTIQMRSKYNFQYKIQALCDNLYSFIFIMGQNQTNPFREGGQIMNDYQIQQRIPELFLTFLQHKKTTKQYLLRQLTFNEIRQFSVVLQKLQKRKQLNHINLTNLQVVQDRTEDQMCSNFFKVYTLWEYPKKCLIDDIASRTLQNKPYTSSQLWTLLEHCANGLAYFQEKGFGHQCLTSKIILFDEKDNVKVADPLSYGLTTNLQYVLSNRYNKSIYLSPQQCECIKTQRPIINKNTYKNDVYSLALIILQSALLEKQDKCYLEDCSTINQSVVTKNIGKLGEKYGQEIKVIIQIMTDQKMQTRPDWIGLQKIINEVKNNKKLIQNKVTAKRQIIASSPPQEQYRSSQRNQRYTNPQGLPLPTIVSVSNEGGSSIKQNSTLVNNMNPIPPLSYSSQIGNISNKPSEYNTKVNFNQVKSQVQPSDQYSNGSNNPNFLPVYSNMPKSPSAQQGTINFKYVPNITINHNPVDMTATFGNGRNAIIPQMATFEPRRQILLPTQPITTFKKLNEKQQIVLPLSNRPLLVKNSRGNLTGFVSNQQIQSPRNIQNKNASRPNPPYEYPQNQPVYIEQRFAKGSRYEGYKLKGMRHGQGKFFYQDGGRYEGQWKQNKMNGFGKLFYQSDQIAYQGEWVNDQFHGWGKLYNQNPSKLSMGFDYRNFDQIEDYWDYYEGYFIQDLKNGKGSLRFSNGQLFEGTFADDMVQGQGIFSCKDGQIVHAIWMENHLVQMVN